MLEDCETVHRLLLDRYQNNYCGCVRDVNAMIFDTDRSLRSNSLSERAASRNCFCAAISFIMSSGKSLKYSLPRRVLIFNDGEASIGFVDAIISHAVTTQPSS